MRVIITGGTGLLGTALAYNLHGQHEVILLSGSSKMEFDECQSVQADITDANRISNALEHAAPDAVIHTAALTNVDYCEDHPEEANKVNEIGTANVANYCAANNVRLVHISTDYVFDGSKPGGFYLEGDAVNPANLYAQTKLAGEKRVQESCKDYAIVRTTMYGWNARGQKNFAMKVVEALEAKNRISAFTNISNTPLLANDLASVTAKLLFSNAIGIFHAGCTTRVNRREFAQAIAKQFGLDASLIDAVELKPGMLAAARPLDVSLNSSKLEKLLGVKMPSLAEGLARFRKLRERGYLQEFKVVKG